MINNYFNLNKIISLRNYKLLITKQKIMTTNLVSFQIKMNKIKKIKLIKIYNNKKKNILKNKKNN
jgi:hypothetical protein